MINRAVKAESKLVKTVVTGVVVAIIATIIGAFCGTFMVSREMIGEGNMPLLSGAIWAVSSFLGALISSALPKENKLLSIVLVDACYFLLLAGAGILLFESNFGTILTACVAIIIGSIPIAVVSFNAKNKKDRRKRYRV